MRALVHFINILLSLIVLTSLGACVPSNGSSAFTATQSEGVITPTAPTPAPDTVEGSWPRIFTAGTDEITIYPPAMQSWSGTTVTGTCPMSIAQTGGKTQNFGTMSFTAATEVNKLNRMVTLSQITVTGISLPENPAKQNSLMSEIASRSLGKSINVALDRFEAAVPNMTSGPSVASAPLQKRASALRGLAQAKSCKKVPSYGSLKHCVSPAAYKARSNNLAKTFALMALPTACKKSFFETPACSKSKRRGGMACKRHISCTVIMRLCVVM